LGGGTILLETLEDIDDPSPLTKCCPELVKHLDISLGVDCHRLLVVILEPEWSNDAIFGDGNPGSALQSVMAFADSGQGVCYPRRCCS